MATSVNPFPSLGNTVSLSPLHDAHGRSVRYLRLSVTDRCNLHCLYCRSVEQRDFIPHENILRYEEMARVVRIVHGMGVRKVRLTGGEPFARKGCDDFLAMLHARHNDLDLRLTTNATLLEPHIPLLRRVGVSVINISLDSFDRATFARVTGHDLLPSVLAAVDGLLVAGLRVKINAVALRGVNDSQLDDFVHAAKTLPVDVRFIEFMPMGSGTRWDEQHFWPADQIRADAERLVRLLPDDAGSDTSGPARMFRIVGGKGRLGFISPLSNHFCASCNRLRLTSDGNVRTCLFADKEYALRGMLRTPGLDDSCIARTISNACRLKPVGAELLAARQGAAVAAKHMVGIGG